MPVVFATAFGPALHLGGAPPLAVVVWSCVACFALVLTGIQFHTLRRDYLFVAACVVLFVTAIQLVPLPPALLRLLDRRSFELSARALSPLGVDWTHQWRPAHLDPGNGRLQALYLVGLVAAYLVSKRLAYRGAGEGVVRTVGWSTLAVVVLAIIHASLGLDRVYGLYAPRAQRIAIVSPLVNTNHLAAYAGIGLILWTSASTAASNVLGRSLAIVASIACGLTLALSLSRGGIAAAIGGLLLLILIGSRMTPKRADGRRWQVWGGPVVLACAVSAGVYVAWESLRAEYLAGDLSKTQFVWSALRAAVRHPLLGTGSGGLYVAVAQDARLPGWATVTRAENHVADLAASFGIGAAVLVVLLALRWLIHHRPVATESSPTYVAGWCAVVSVALHDFADFSLWFGATGFATALLCGALAGERQQQREPANVRPRSGSRWVAVPLLASAILAGFVLPRGALDAERDRVERSLSGDPLPRASVAGILERHPGDPYIALALGTAGIRRRQDDALRFVARAIELSPAWAEPHIVLAHHFASIGLISQSIVEIRLAATASDRNHGALAMFLVDLGATRAQLERATPRGASAVPFLELVAIARPAAETSRAADDILLARNPRNVGALLRSARRASDSRDVSNQQALLLRLVEGSARDPRGYLELARLAIQADRLSEADAWLDRGMRATVQTTPFLPLTAEIRSRRGDAPGMRSAIQQLLDRTGSAVDQRSETLALLGRLEGRLGNRAQSLAAYERAEAVAFPEHPYIADIVTAAHSLEDWARLRAACVVLRDQPSPGGDASHLCDEGDRRNRTVEF